MQNYPVPREMVCCVVCVCVRKENKAFVLIEALDNNCLKPLRAVEARDVETVIKLFPHCFSPLCERVYECVSVCVGENVPQAQISFTLVSNLWKEEWLGRINTSSICSLVAWRPGQALKERDHKRKMLCRCAYACGVCLDSPPTALQLVTASPLFQDFFLCLFLRTALSVVRI